jgi:hypothetical protein
MASPLESEKPHRGLLPNDACTAGEMLAIAVVEALGNKAILEFVDSGPIALNQPAGANAGPVAEPARGLRAVLTKYVSC